MKEKAWAVEILTSISTENLTRYLFMMQLEQKRTILCQKTLQSNSATENSNEKPSAAPAPVIASSDTGTLNDDGKESKSSEGSEGTLVDKDPLHPLLLQKYRKTFFTVRLASYALMSYAYLHLSGTEPSSS